MLSSFSDSLNEPIDPYITFIVMGILLAIILAFYLICRHKVEVEDIEIQRYWREYEERQSLYYEAMRDKMKYPYSYKTPVPTPRTKDN